MGPAAAWRRAWEAAGDGEQYVWLEASGAREAAAALTAASSSAEMVNDSQRAWSGQAHRTGCADYEELEWLGDGVLKLLAIMHTMTLPSMEAANVRDLQLKAEPMQGNITLCKQSKLLGLPGRCLLRQALRSIHIH